MRRLKFKLGLLLLAGGLAAGCSGSRAGVNANANANVSKPAAAVDVSTARAVQRNLPGFLEVTGNLAADAQADVAPLVSGKIVEVRGDIGSWVEKGAVLARLDDRDARLRLQQAEAQLNQARAGVGQARAAAAQARAQVRQAEVRLGMRPGQQTLDIDGLADPRAVKVQLDLAEKELQRFARLLETGDVSRSAYDQRRAQRDQLAQQYDSVRAASAQSFQSVVTARAAVQTADQQVVSAQQQVSTAETQVAQARKAIADAMIYAPMSGYILERPADVGEYVSVQGGGGRVATIVRTNPLRVRIDVPEQAISEVRAGQSVSVKVADWPDRNFAGTIARLSPNVTTTSRTLTVEAEIDNRDNLLRPGQFVTVRVLRAKSVPSVLVPQRAVKTEGATSYVFVIKEGRAARRQVQLGEKEGDLIHVKSGVGTDELVATGNVELLTDGIAVRQ
jgi:RND family efflux transporter MFP subunit